MNSFELNKVTGAVLGTLLFALGTGFVSELIYEPKPAGNRGWDLPGGSAEHGGGGGEAKEAAAAPAESIAMMLPHADVEKGKAGTKACQACHNFAEGAGAKVGPDLYNVVERKKGSFPGFDYSAGMKAKGGEWTYADLDEFLTKPSAYIKGTKMSYAGITSPQERANVIAYLRTLSENPKPLPAAEPAAAKPEGDKGAGKGAEKKDEGKKEDGKKDEGKKAEGASQADPSKKPAEKETPTGAVAPAEKGAGNGGSINGTSQGADKPAQTTTSGGQFDNGAPGTPTSPNAVEPARKPNEAAVDKAEKGEAGHHVDPEKSSPQ